MREVCPRSLLGVREENKAMKDSIKYLVIFSALILSASNATNDLAQSNPPYEITQSVIASGGGKSDSDQFSVTGTVGQSVAGTNSTGSPFAVSGGFWQFFIGPTAAMVSISGRVSTSNGQPISRVIVIIEGSHGGMRTAMTNTFGRFRIDDIAAGQTYIVSAAHRRYQFVPQAIMVTDSIGDLVIRPIE